LPAAEGAGAGGHAQGSAPHAAGAGVLGGGGGGGGGAVGVVEAGHIPRAVVEEGDGVADLRPAAGGVGTGACVGRRKRF
jgi:hypothetical protein